MHTIVIQAAVLDTVSNFFTKIGDMIPGGLKLVGAGLVLLVWMKSRSWKAAVLAGVGASLVLAMTGNLDWASKSVQDQVKNSMPAIVRPLELPPSSADRV